MKQNKIIRIEDHSFKTDIIKALTDALFEDPAFVWLYRPDTYKKMSWLNHYYYNVAYQYREIYTTKNKVLGASLWLPPGQVITFSDLLKNGLFAAPFNLGLRGSIKSLKALVKNEKYKKKFAPEKFWYLFSLGLIPDARGQGLGEKLLRPVFDKADEKQECCYCESSNSKNISFYQRMGFKIQHQETVDGLPDSPVVYYLLRKPQ